MNLAHHFLLTSLSPLSFCQYPQRLPIDIEVIAHILAPSRPFSCRKPCRLLEHTTLYFGARRAAATSWLRGNAPEK